MRSNLVLAACDTACAAQRLALELEQICGLTPIRIQVVQACQFLLAISVHIILTPAAEAGIVLARSFAAYAAAVAAMLRVGQLRQLRQLRPVGILMGSDMALPIGTVLYSNGRYRTRRVSYRLPGSADGAPAILLFVISSLSGYVAAHIRYYIRKSRQNSSTRSKEAHP